MAQGCGGECRIGILRYMFVVVRFELSCDNFDQIRGKVCVFFRIFQRKSLKIITLRPRENVCNKIVYETGKKDGYECIYVSCLKMKLISQLKIPHTYIRSFLIHRVERHNSVKKKVDLAIRYKDARSIFKETL